MLKVPKIFLLSLLLASCTQTSHSPTQSPITSSSSSDVPVSPSPSSTPAAAYLISPEGIGEARLGMKLGELKQKLAEGAELGEDQPFLVDLNAIPVSINKEVQYYILHFSSEPLTDSDPIPFLVTGDRISFPRRLSSLEFTHSTGRLDKARFPRHPPTSKFTHSTLNECRMTKYELV